MNKSINSQSPTSVINTEEEDDDDVDVEGNCWVSPNRQNLFSSLKRGSSSCAPSSSGRYSSPSSKSFFKSGRKKISENYSSASKTSCSAASTDLFVRSVSSLESRTHRRDLHQMQSPPEDIKYEYTPKKQIKNYKPPSERVTESFERRKQFVEDFEEMREMKTKEDFPFSPEIVSKQTNIPYHDLNSKKKHVVSPEEPEFGPFIDPKSKEIAKIITQKTNIYDRQATKMYQSKSETPKKTDRKNKKTKEEIDEIICRLTKQTINLSEEEDFQEEEDDDEEDLIEDEEFGNYRRRRAGAKTISVKTINRLVKNSVERYKTRVSNYRGNSNPYKPQISQKSIDIANSASQNHRDLFEESLTDVEIKEKEAENQKAFREAQEMAECNYSPKMRKTPEYLKRLQEISFGNFRQNMSKDSKEVEPIEPYLAGDINVKPFSFDKIRVNQKI